MSPLSLRKEGQPCKVNALVLALQLKGECSFAMLTLFHPIKQQNMQTSIK